MKIVVSLYLLFFSVCSFAGNYSEENQIHPAIGSVFTQVEFPKVLAIARTHLPKGTEGLRISTANISVRYPECDSIGTRCAEISILVYPERGGGCVVYPIGHILAEADGNWLASNIRFQAVPDSKEDAARVPCGPPPSKN